MIDAAPTLRRYPIEIATEDGTELTIRPLNKDDKIALAKFFIRVSEEDRFYLKENVTAPEVIHEWAEHLNFDRAIPIIALVGDRIVADATLHRSRTPARRHIGELRIVVAPEYRGKGIGNRLIHELIDLARALELDRVFFELVDRRELGAIRSAVQAGFEEVAILRGRVRDIYGSLQDIVILELSLDDEVPFGHF